MNHYNFIYSKNKVNAGKYNYYIVLSKELPKTLNFGILKNFLTSNHSIDLSINIIPMNDSKMIEILDMENETIEPELKSIKTYTSRSRKLERKLLSTRALQEYIISGKGHLFQVSITFFSKSEKEEDSKNSFNYIMWESKKNIFNTKVPTFEYKKNFHKILPLGIIDEKNSQYIHTHALGALFPFLVDYVTMEDGIFYGINDKNQTPVIFNRWAFPSSHSIISGTTGFGKSYFVKLSIIRELISDKSIKVFIIDPLGEYIDLVKMLDGKTIEVGKKGNEINIFELGSEKNIEEKILRLRTLFSILLDLTKNDLALIDAGLSMLYSKKKEPRISDFIDILKSFNDKKSIEISYLLEKLVSGSLKSIDSKTYISIDKNIVSFDLRGINDEFMTFYMVMLLDFIYGKIAKDFEKKLVIVDETWKLLKNEYAASFLDTMFRHVRRWKCSMNVISQKADDFLLTPFGRSMMNNSLFHIIFKHGYISEEMKSFYKFTNSEENYILNAEKPNISGNSQAYFISHPLRFPMRIIATKEENYVITTNPDELKAKKL
ncbi:MAG: VirB4 family type IV secretion system protein [Thermoplasmata archaeon]